MCTSAQYLSVWYPRCCKAGSQALGNALQSSGSAPCARRSLGRLAPDGGLSGHAMQLTVLTVWPGVYPLQKQLPVLLYQYIQRTAFPTTSPRF